MPEPRGSNVEIVRQAIEAHNSDDLATRDEDERVASRVAVWDPDCEYTSVVAALEPATYHGHDGIRRYMRDLAERWAQWRAEADEVFETGPDTVFATFRFRAVGKDSGVPIEAQLASVFVLSEGRILRGRTYPSRQEALEASQRTREQHR